MLRPGTFALTALLAAMTAIGPLTTDMYLPSLPDIAHKLDASTAQVQLTISSYLIGFAFGQIVYGPVSDRHGRKPVLIAAVALYCLATLACALSTSIEMLIVGRFVQAIGGAGGIVLARAIVRDLYSGARAGRELSLMGAVMALAPVCAPLLGGVLQTGFGWRSVFFTLVSIGLVGAAIVVAADAGDARPSARPSRCRSRACQVLSRRGAQFGLSCVSRPCLDQLRRAVRLDLRLVLRAAISIWPHAVPVRRRLRGRFGRLHDRHDLCRAAGDAAWHRPHARRRMCRDGGRKGPGMVAAIALGLTSAASVILPMAVYLGGMGMVLPQALAGAMTPFPERAGAASALLGFIQQTVSALCGAIVGVLLGQSAWPLVGAVAAMGCASLLLWVSTRTIRAHARQKLAAE